MGDAVALDKYYRTCTQLFDLRIPIMKSTTDFKGSFKSSLNNEDSTNLIEKLTLTRNDMFSTFSQLSTPDAKLAAVDNYLPNIFLLMNTLNNQEKLTFDKNIIFEWKGSFTAGEEYFKSSEITYEVIMVLQTKAILHNAIAKGLVDADPLNFLTDAGKHLLTASSIMQYLHTNLLTKWNQSFNLKIGNPVELNVKVVLSLSLLFKASAQSMAVAKALGNETTPATIKARLALSVVNSIVLSFNEVNYLPTAPTLFPALLTHMAVVREFFSALAHWQLAQSYSDKHEVGLAIAFCAAAKRKLQEQSLPKYKPTDPGLPKLTGLYLINLAPAVAMLHHKLDTLTKHAEQENRFIYFLVVPTQLPELPAEASVMNPAPYEEPVYTGEPIVFVYKAPKSIIGSIFSSFMGSADASGKPAVAAVAAVDSIATGADAVVHPEASAPPSVVPGVPVQYPYSAMPAPTHSNSSSQQLSDEAYARQLQQQYHNEAAAASVPPAVPVQYQQPQPQPQNSGGYQYQQHPQIQQAHSSGGHPHQYNSKPSGTAPLVFDNGVNYPKI